MSTSYMIDECFSGLLMLNGFCLVFTSLILNLFSLVHCWLDSRKGIRPVKKSLSNSLLEAFGYLA